MEPAYQHSEYLFRLARSGKPEDMASLTKLVSGLLQAQLSKGEMFLVQDLLLRMLREATSELRCDLAQHLATEEKCPQALIDYLVYECPLDDSQPLLIKGVMLQDDFLIDVAQRFNATPYWQTIAQRENISTKLALYLISTKDHEVCHLLIANDNADLGAQGMGLLIDIAVDAPSMHKPLLQRAEITTELAAKIYWVATETLQQEIMQRFDIDKATLDTALWYVTTQRAQAGSKVRSISMEMLDLVRRIPKISTRQIIVALEKDDLALFSCLCGTVMNVNPEAILYKLDTHPMWAIAVLCSALSVTRAQYTNLFLMWRSRAATATITTGNDLARALAAFDKIKTPQALIEINSWQRALHTQQSAAS